MHKGPYTIPTKSDAELSALQAKTKPLVLLRSKHIRRLKEIPQDLRNTSYLWHPTLTCRAVPRKFLQEVARVRTLHTYGAPVFFKPSIAEVLAQMPEGLDADYFCIMERPESADDLNAESGALNVGYHVATTVFFQYLPWRKAPIWDPLT